MGCFGLSSSPILGVEAIWQIEHTWLKARDIELRNIGRVARSLINIIINHQWVSRSCSLVHHASTPVPIPLPRASTRPPRKLDGYLV